MRAKAHTPPFGPGTADQLWTEARRVDRVRSLATLFGPPAVRPALLALLRLDHELARTTATASQPTVGLIRMQWWRDALAELAAGGPPRDHTVVHALQPILRDAPDLLAALEELFDAREADLDGEPVTAIGYLVEHARQRSGRLHGLLARVAGVTDEGEGSAATAVGTAFGLTGYALRPPRGAEALVATRAAELGRLAVGELDRARAQGRFSVAALPAVLPAVAARREGERLSRGEPATMADGPSVLLAMGWAASRRRI